MRPNGENYIMKKLNDSCLINNFSSVSHLKNVYASAFVNHLLLAIVHNFQNKAFISCIHEKIIAFTS